MLNNEHTQFQQNVFQRRLQHPEQATTVRGVWQDKGAPRNERIASLQPAPQEKLMRAHQMNRSISRSQKRPTPKRKTVHITLWVKPIVKAELQRLAESEGLSVSAAGGAFLGKAMQANIDMQYGALFKPIIETTIRKELRRSFSRMIVFQARISLSLDVIKGLVKWLCRRLAGASKSQVDSVEEKSRKDARVNLVYRTPQLEKITEELEKTIMEEEERTN